MKRSYKFSHAISYLKRKKGIGITLMLVACSAGADSTPNALKNYAYLYFENGYPTRLQHRRPQSEANLTARANPDLVFQTGYYSFMLDCDDIELKGYDALSGSDYLSALNEDVSVFTPATSFLLRVTQNGVNYTCTGAIVQGNGVDHVRLIESGQYVKRIDHTGLTFRDGSGNELVVNEACRLEITAWPDRLTILLDSSRETLNPITRSTIQVVSPDGVTHTTDVLSNQARLTLQPQEDTKLNTLNIGDYVTRATNLQDDTPLNARFDADTHAFSIDVPANPVRYPSGANRVDEYLIEVRNPLSNATNIPLRFIQPNPRAITGTVMLLSDAESGRPLGIPVQLSKNWHGNSADDAHAGFWLRGSTVLTLQAGETRRIKLRLAYGYWGGAGTISYSQLSLIGYGRGHWKWEKSALGAWGESLTLDPTLHLGAAFLDDMRPNFTQSYNNSGAYKDGGTVNTTHDWTENVGGGDFLIYRDSANTYHWLKRVKTCFYQTGPNLTEVHYSGVTDDNKIRANYSTRMVSTLDYHRCFHTYEYQFLEDVNNPERLVFFQMAADHYNTAAYSRFHLGDANGLISSIDINDPTNPIAGGNSYKGNPLAMDGKWLSFEDQTGDGAGVTTTAKAARGLIPLNSTLNGQVLPLYAHTYGSNHSGGSVLFDFSSDSVRRSFVAGDTVAGEMEFILPPQHRDNYWGSDAELIARLNTYGDAPWQPVRDELAENIGIHISAHQGAVLNTYPLEIEADSGSGILTDLTIENGGIGHIPILLKGADAGLELKVQRHSSGTWIDLESVDIANHTYYQAIQNANGTMDYAFNVPRPAGAHDLESSWRIRILYAQFPRVDGPLEETLDLSGADSVTERGYLYYQDTQFVKHPNSAWTVNNGTLSNTSTDNSRTAEGALAHAVTIDNLAVSQGDIVNLSFDCTLNDPAEVLYVHLWGLVGSPTDNRIMNLGAQNGNTWYFDQTGVDMYNLADGLSTGGAAATAAIAITGNTGPQSYRASFDLSAYSEPANELSDFDYLALAFARKIDGASSPAVSISDVKVSVQSRGPEAQPYEKWASDLGLTQPAAGDDSDADGLSNFAEFAFGGDPNLASSAGPQPFTQKVQVDGIDYLQYVYQRRINADSVLSYTLQSCEDLSQGNWVDNGHIELTVNPGSMPGYEQVTNRFGISFNTKTFMRLIVETK